MRVENYQDPRPLHVATILEGADLVWLFQEAPADLSKPEPVCSLHLAVEVHAADLLEILLRAGSDPSVAMSVAVCHGAAPLSGPTPSSLASCTRGAPEPEDEGSKPGSCSSGNSDSDAGDEGVSQEERWGGPAGGSG